MKYDIEKHIKDKTKKQMADLERRLFLDGRGITGELKAFDLSYRKGVTYVLLSPRSGDYKAVDTIEFSHSCYREKFALALVKGDDVDSPFSACIECGKQFPSIKKLETMAKFQEITKPASNHELLKGLTNDDHTQYRLRR